MSSGDDWGAFTGREHMFFGLEEPYVMIREAVEDGLKRQVPDTIVESIVTEGEPKYLTIGKKREDDPEKLLVAHFAFCVAATISVRFDEGRRTHTMPASLTFAFARVDEPGKERMRSWFDLEGDAGRGLDDELFQRRFLALRTDAEQPEGGEPA